MRDGDNVRKCPICGRLFVPSRTKQVYCRDLCYEEQNRRRARTRYRTRRRRILGLPPVRATYPVADVS